MKKITLNDYSKKTIDDLKDDLKESLLNSSEFERAFIEHINEDYEILVIEGLEFNPLEILETFGYYDNAKINYLEEQLEDVLYWIEYKKVDKLEKIGLEIDYNNIVDVICFMDMLSDN